MKQFRILSLAIAVVLSACGVQISTPNNSIEFGDILEPHYRSVINKIECGEGQDISVPVFDKQEQTLNFRYSLCSSDAEGEMADFSYESKFSTLGGYVFGKYKIITPESAFKINPNAKKYTYLDIPIFGITKLGEMSPKEYLKNKKTMHKMDWNICEIKKWGEHIWGLENPSFREVPTADYTIDNYASFSEWKLNHEADKASYRKKYGDQMLKNRACANEQHNWYVAKDGIIITLPSPPNFTGGVNPATITYTENG